MKQRTWVIGGNTGIGKGIADKLKRTNDHLVFVSDEDEVDVRNTFRIADYIRNYAPFDNVIFSAGVNTPCFIESMNSMELQRMFDVNVIGFIKVLNELVRIQGHGTMCAIVSDAANRPMRNSIGYCSSKAALQMAIRCASRELSPNWRIFGVSPGVVYDTPMTRNINDICAKFREIPIEEIEKDIELTPMGRYISVTEVAELVSQMLNAGPFLSGTTVDISGGSK